MRAMLSPSRLSSASDLDMTVPDLDIRRKEHETDTDWFALYARKVLPLPVGSG